MEILEIKPRWYHGFGNSPGIEIIVDKMLPFDSFVYKNVDEKPDHTMLISTNNDPWVKFVYIADPNGSPTTNGALGGTYKLDDGTEFKSRSGWSSRASAINKHYRDHLYDEIVEVSIKTGKDSIWWAGFSVYQTHLYNHPNWPLDLYLVREITSYGSGEPHWTISADPDKVVKGDK